jgi:hypothetical protein
MEIETFGEVFAGSDRPIIVTDGFLHLTGDKATDRGRSAGGNARLPARVAADRLCVG